MALDKDSFAGSGIAAEGPRTRGEGRPAGPVDSFELHGVEQVFLDDLLPDDALSKAMEACDEAAIWAQYGEAPDKSRFLRSLGSLAGYYSTHQPHRRGASTLWHNALMAVAFLLPPERRPAVQPAGTDQKAASAVYMQLQQWLGYGQTVRVIADSVRYRDLCNWSPLLQLEYLQALTWRKSSCNRPVVRVSAEFPEDWPQLAFMLGSVQRWNRAPQLASSSAGGDTEWQLRTRLAAHLGYIHQRPVQAAKVLQPLFFADAVLAGLRLWIRELVDRRLVSAWDMQCHVEDFVVLQLTRIPDHERVVAVPIRLHHMGAGDCEALLLFLEDSLGLPSHRTSPNA